MQKQVTPIVRTPVLTRHWPGCFRLVGLSVVMVGVLIGLNRPVFPVADDLLRLQDEDVSVEEDVPGSLIEQEPTPLPVITPVEDVPPPSMSH